MVQPQPAPAASVHYHTLCHPGGVCARVAADQRHQPAQQHLLHGSQVGLLLREERDQQHPARAGDRLPALTAHHPVAGLSMSVGVRLFVVCLAAAWDNGVLKCISAVCLLCSRTLVALTTSVCATHALSCTPTTNHTHNLHTCTHLQGLCMPRLVYLVAQSEGRHYSLSAVDRRMGELYL